MIKRIISSGHRRLFSKRQDTSKRPTGQCHIKRDTLLDARHLLGADQANVVVDGGAFRGDIADRMTRVFPQAVVHAIEPNHETFARLAERFASTPRIQCHHCALSHENGEAMFHVTNRADCCSLSMPDESASRWHGEVMDVKDVRPVPTRRLDDLFANQTIDVLKLDLQGHELDALRGCDDILSNTKIIIAEVSFVALYSGQPLFGDVSEFMLSRGFYLHYLSDVWLRPSGQITQADAMFCNERWVPFQTFLSNDTPSA